MHMALDYNHPEFIFNRVVRTWNTLVHELKINFRSDRPTFLGKLVLLNYFHTTLTINHDPEDRACSKPFA